MLIRAGIAQSRSGGIWLSGIPGFRAEEGVTAASWASKVPSYLFQVGSVVPNDLFAPAARR